MRHEKTLGACKTRFPKKAGKNRLSQNVKHERRSAICRHRGKRERNARQKNVKEKRDLRGTTTKRRGFFREKAVVRRQGGTKRDRGKKNQEVTKKGLV